MIDTKYCLGIHDEDIYTTYIIDLVESVTCFNCNTTTEVHDVEDGTYTSVMNSIINISVSVTKEGTFWYEVLGISPFLLRNLFHAQDTRI